MKMVWLAILAMTAGHEGGTPVPDRMELHAQAQASVKVVPISRPSGFQALSRRWDRGPFGAPTGSLIVEDFDNEESDESWLVDLDALPDVLGPWHFWMRPDSSGSTAHPLHLRLPSLSRIPLRC